MSETPVVGCVTEQFSEPKLPAVMSNIDAEGDRRPATGDQPPSSSQEKGFFRVDLLVMAAIGLAAWLAAIWIDGFEILHQFSRDHENWQLDEVVVGLVVFFIVGTVYMVRRSVMLTAQIEARKEAEGKFSWLARHDPLTGLPNRRLLDEFVCAVDQPDEGADARRFAVFAVDLDGFKKANDLLGHAQGDAILKTVADRLSALEESVFVARAGGDEFVLIAPRDTIGDVGGLARRILDVLSEPVAVGSTQAQIGSCVGIALTPDDGPSLADALRYADVALGEAKRSGRDHALAFTTSMGEAMVRRAMLEAELRHAVRSGRIAPRFQPLIDLRTGTVKGFEAVPHWTRAGEGTLSAGAVLAIAEDLGLVVELSENLLRQSASAAVEWPEEMQLSVKLAEAQLADKLATARLLKILKDAGLPARRLTVEVTEVALLSRWDDASRTLRELQQAGVRIILDDFGAGFASLPELTNFDLDGIKIDRNVLSGNSPAAATEKVIEAMVAFGHAFEITVTADGVDTDGQFEWLKRLGCDRGQGEHLGLPLEPRTVPLFIASQA